MISRRKFLGTTAVASIAASMGLPFTAVPALAAPQNPQRISSGFVFPVYVNATGTDQSMTPYVYVNQTQYTPATSPSQSNLLTLGVG